MAPFSRGKGVQGRGLKKRSVPKKRKAADATSQRETYSSSRLSSTKTNEQLYVTVSEDLETQSLQDVSSDDDSFSGETLRRNPHSSLLQSLGRNDRIDAKRAVPSEQSHAKARPNSSSHPTVTSNEHPDNLIDLESDPLSEQENYESEDQASDLTDEDQHVTDNAFDRHFCQASDSRLQQHIRDVSLSSSATSRIQIDSTWRNTSVISTSWSDQALYLDPKRTNLTSLKLAFKQRLRSRADELLSNAQEVEMYLANLFGNYMDVLFYGRNSYNAVNLRWLLSLHALNHVLKTRDRVLKNNERASREIDLDDTQLRDQGFTRPKVLFLLPTRQSCYKFVQSLAALYEPEQQENRKRFDDTYGNAGEPISENKPQDFRDLFEGNEDDLFRVGIKFTRKTIKIFTQFYNSDMIFASPLGLRMAIGDKGSKHRDYDFLSSIELLIVDQGDALLMQNWEHIEHIFDHLNLQPNEAHGCDFGRVRPWCLDGHGKYFRQTVVLTAFNTPEINSLFNFKMLNYEGKHKIGEAKYKGLISAPDALFKQTFYRFDAAEPVGEPDARFRYFTTKLLPRITKYVRENPDGALSLLIFIPSYMDFVRIRNFFATSTAARDIPFASLSEYTAAPEVARARSHFMKGRHKVLLYTGRSHHYRRYRLKGARNVLFYGLPDNPLFYKEIASDFLALGVAAGKLGSNEAHAQVLFSKWDALRLERIVGTDRLGTMLTGRTGDIFEFIP